MNTLTTRAKVGYWLAVVLGVIDIASLLIPTPPDGQGPPLSVTIFGAAMGVITLAAAVVIARNGSRTAVRVMAAARILSGLTAVPAFFVPSVPPVFVAFGAAVVVLTVVAVVLLMSRARTGPVTPSGRADRLPGAPGRGEVAVSVRFETCSEASWADAHEPRPSVSARRSTASPSSTATTRSWCGSRAAWSPPMRCRSRTSARTCRRLPSRARRPPVRIPGAHGAARLRSTRPFRRQGRGRRAAPHPVAGRRSGRTRLPIDRP